MLLNKLHGNHFQRVMHLDGVFRVFESQRGVDMKQFTEMDKVLWAIDPYAESVMLQRSAAWAIQRFTQDNPSTEIQPIYVVNDWTTETLPQRHVRPFLEKLEAFGNDSLQQIIYRIPLKNIRPLEILSRPFQSVEQGARELISHAERQNFKLIVASTRTHRGKGLFGLSGSFVESLSDLSELPLLIVNPKWRRVTGMHSIMFPSDLSQESYDWFLQALEFAKSRKSHITLFHKVYFPLSQPFDVAIRILPETRDILFRKVKTSQSEAKKWTQVAKKCGVRTSVVIDSHMQRSLDESLLKCLEKHPGVTIISPPLSVTYPRSTIRRLIRKTPFPMLVIPTLLQKEAPAFGVRHAA
jgi:nucleotide-binding universal stress UspA family protein